jgi:hypothetical protein
MARLTRCDCRLTRRVAMAMSAQVEQARPTCDYRPFIRRNSTVIDSGEFNHTIFPRLKPGDLLGTALSGHSRREDGVSRRVDIRGIADSNRDALPRSAGSAGTRRQRVAGR